jgi:hypothetical protein
MEDVIASYVVDHEKSSYRIELLKVASGKIYISLEQTVYTDISEYRSVVKMKPQALNEIVRVLLEIQHAPGLHSESVAKRGKLNPKNSIANPKFLINFCKTAFYGFI